MLLLDNTSAKIQVTSSVAVPLEIHASYMVADGSPLAIPKVKNTQITTATTADVVASPASGEARNVQTLTIRNAHASTSSVVTIVHNDGTTTVGQYSVSLGAGETMQWLDGVGLQVLTSSGAVKTSQNQGSNATGGAQSSSVLAADVTNNNAVANTIADVTGLSFPVTSGKKYRFRFEINYTSAATATGSRWSINGPGGTMRYRSDYSLTATTMTINEGLAAHDLPAACNATSAATAANNATVEGFYEASSTGTVIARFASEVASSAIVAKAGSVVYFQEVL